MKESGLYCFLHQATHTAKAFGRNVWSWGLLGRNLCTTLRWNTSFWTVILPLEFHMPLPMMISQKRLYQAWYGDNIERRCRES